MKYITILFITLFIIGCGGGGDVSYSEDWNLVEHGKEPSCAHIKEYTDYQFYNRDFSLMRSKT